MCNVNKVKSCLIYRHRQTYENKSLHILDCKKIEKINKKEAVGLIMVTIIVLISAFLNQLGCPETTLLCNLQLK